MKNWLRKIAAWLWATKERIVLAVVVIVACVRVYPLLPLPDVYPFQKPSPTDEKNFRPPGDQLPADVETPGVPPRMPAPPDFENWTNLWRTNPFTYVSPGAGRRVVVEGREIDLELLNIQKHPDGSYRVQIRSANRKKGWYKEGDPFESYELLTIEADTECIWVFAEEIGRRVQICKD